LQNVTIVVLFFFSCALVLLGSLYQDVFAHSATGQFEPDCGTDNLASGTSHTFSIDPASPVAGDTVRFTTNGSGGDRVITVAFKDGTRVLKHQNLVGRTDTNPPLDNVFDGTYEMFSCLGTRNSSTGELTTTHISGPIIFTVVGFPDSDGDGVPLPEDCDDLDKRNFPGNKETPGDQQDNNCNDLIDEFLIEDDPAFNELSDKVQDLMMQPGAHSHDLDFGDTIDGQGITLIDPATGMITCPDGHVMTGLTTGFFGGSISLTPKCTPLSISDVLTMAVGGMMIQVNAIALLAAGIGVDPLVTGLLLVTVVGISVQVAWILHKKKK